MIYLFWMFKFIFGFVVVFVVVFVFVQSIFVGVGGQVVFCSGQFVVGVEVIIIYIELGIVLCVIIDVVGCYNVCGLCVGGLYLIIIIKLGEGIKIEDGVYLGVNQIGIINVILVGDFVVINLDIVQVIVVGGGLEVFSVIKMGLGINISQQQIEVVLFVGGNIQDLMCLDLCVIFIDCVLGLILVGGQNLCFNLINIDGVLVSDIFGLEGNNMLICCQLVVMEVIEVLDINLFNYDVSIVVVVGVIVNVVIKLGINEFYGLVYGIYCDGDWFGDNLEGQLFKGFIKEEIYGMILGGLIVKDKLFFFVNYEKFKQVVLGVDLSGIVLGKVNLQFILVDVICVQQIVQSYGINVGGLESNGDMEMEEYVLKLDWNISENYCVNICYSKIDQSKLCINGMVISLVLLSLYWYQYDKINESYVVQLFSDWILNFLIELKVLYCEYLVICNVFIDVLSICIFFGGNEVVLMGDLLYLGIEVNFQDNIFEIKVWNYYVVVIWILGDYDVKFGVLYDINDIYNYFGVNLWGVYIFYGLDNFVVGCWSSYNYNLECILGLILVDYKYSNLVLFVQDIWYVNNNLILILGVCVDCVDISLVLIYNVVVLIFFGCDNSEVLSNKFLIQLCVGFNYIFDSECLIQLCGGVGLFQGDVLQVWLSNSYLVIGFNNLVYVYIVYDFMLWFSLNKDGQLVLIILGLNCQNVNFVGSDFKMLLVYKVNLVFDYEMLWYGIVVLVELLVIKVKDVLYYRNLNLGLVQQLGLDGCEFYYVVLCNGNLWINNDVCFGWNCNYDVVYEIVNIDKGCILQFIVLLSKLWLDVSDWFWNIGYIYIDVIEVGLLISFIVSLGWNYQYVFNVNSEIENILCYQICDCLLGLLNWKYKFFGDYEIKVGLVYEGCSGCLYSYVYVNDVNGDGCFVNDLFYVLNLGEVLFGNLVGSNFILDVVMEKLFYEWLVVNLQLVKYVGGYVLVNQFCIGWINIFDICISQQLLGFMKGYKLEVWLDIQNVGNMFNKKWGNIYDYGFFVDVCVVILQGMKDGKYVYNFRGVDLLMVVNNDVDGFDVGVLQWLLQLGFCYQF